MIGVVSIVVVTIGLVAPINFLTSCVIIGVVRRVLGDALFPVLDNTDPVLITCEDGALLGKLPVVPCPICCTLLVGVCLAELGCRLFVGSVLVCCRIYSTVLIVVCNAGFRIACCKLPCTRFPPDCLLLCCAVPVIDCPPRNILPWVTVLIAVACLTDITLDADVPSVPCIAGVNCCVLRLYCTVQLSHCQVLQARFLTPVGARPYVYFY